MTRKEIAYSFIDKIKSVVSPSISDKKRIVSKRNNPNSGIGSLLAKKRSILDRKERQAKIGASKGKFNISYNHHEGRWAKE